MKNIQMQPGVKGIVILKSKEEVEARWSDIQGLIGAYRSRDLIPADEETTKRMCETLAGSGIGAVFLLYDGTTCVGYIMGLVGPELFTGRPCSSMVGFYVVPEHAGLVWSLINEFLRWSRTKGAKRAFLHVSSGSDIPRWEKAITRKGWSVESFHFSKDLGSEG